MLAYFAVFVVGAVIGFIVCAVLASSSIQEEHHLAWQRGFNHAMDLCRRAAYEPTENED
jgi:hypothetical protein